MPVMMTVEELERFFLAEFPQVFHAESGLAIEAVWERIEEQWRAARPGAQNESAVHGRALPAFCDLCQLPLSAGTPRNNTANTLALNGQKYILCSEPCRWIFLREPERYANHRELTKRVLAGEAPAKLPDLVSQYFQLTPETRGKDMQGGKYAWLQATAQGVGD